MPKRVVLDTNILIAAYFNPNSFSAKLLKLAARNKIDIYWSSSLYREAQTILRFIPPRDRKSILEKVFKSKNRVSRPPKVKVISEDPEDDKILACALKANADFVVSNDKHLLDLKEFKGIRILSPKKTYQMLTPSRIHRRGQERS